MEVRREQALPGLLRQMRVAAATTKAIGKKDIQVLVDNMVKTTTTNKRTKTLFQINLTGPLRFNSGYLNCVIP